MVCTFYGAVVNNLDVLVKRSWAGLWGEVLARTRCLYLSACLLVTYVLYYMCF